MVKNPQKGEFLHTVKLLPEANQTRDPCNVDRKHGHANACGTMWPPLQSQGALNRKHRSELGMRAWRSLLQADDSSEVQVMVFEIWKGTCKT